MYKKFKWDFHQIIGFQVQNFQFGEMVDIRVQFCEVVIADVYFSQIARES